LPAFKFRTILQQQRGQRAWCNNVHEFECTESQNSGTSTKL
jgi:hypothetical protein